VGLTTDVLVAAATAAMAPLRAGEVRFDPKETPVDVPCWCADAGGAHYEILVDETGIAIAVLDGWSPVLQLWAGPASETSAEVFGHDVAPGRLPRGPLDDLALALLDAARASDEGPFTFVPDAIAPSPPPGP